MKKKLLLVSIIPAVALAVIATPALAATQEAASENWAGYVVTAKNKADFSNVSAEWTQPKVTCTSNTGASSYSAYWVGLGGGSESSDALEQIGTQADCSTSGSSKYYAWYELVPSAPVKIGLTIHSDDKVYASTAVNGDQVSFYIIDHTTGQSWSKTLTMTAATPDTSTAEWVTEAPSECAGGTTAECTPLPLANFGTATFTDAHATSDGHTGSISDSRWSTTAIELAPSDSSVFGSGPGGYFGGGAGFGYGDGYSEFSSYSASSGGAAPTSLSDKGTKFQVKYGASLSGASTTSTSTQTQTSGSSSTASGDGYGYGDGYGGYGDGYYGGGYSYGGGYGGGGYGYYSYGGGYGYSGLYGGY